jgi:hypothetical protein
MGRKTGALISAVITLIFFVGIPYLLTNYISPELVAQIEQSGFDFADFTNQMMIIGVITAGLTFVGGFVDPASLIALLVRVAQTGFSLVFMIMLLGAGNLTGLGYTEFNVVLGGVHSSIAMDLRIFVQISIVTILLKVVQIYLEWNEVRVEALASLLVRKSFS